MADDPFVREIGRLTDDVGRVLIVGVDYDTVTLRTLRTRTDGAVALEESCMQPCDPDCEVGPVHCYWVHEPNHKPGWHSQEDCPARELDGAVALGMGQQEELGQLLIAAAWQAGWQRMKMDADIERAAAQAGAP